MNYYLKLCISSFFAGLIMAFAGFELVVMEANNAFVAGAFLQGFGLLLVIYFNLELYNCRICNILSKDKLKAILSLLITLVINIATIIAFAYLFRLGSNEKQSFIDAANKFTNVREITVANIKGKDWYMSIINGFMCALLCYLGGVVYKRSSNALVKVISPLLAVGIFVVCGFENLMTNTLYIAYAQRWNLGTFLNLVMVLIGNTLGVLFTYLAVKLVDEMVTKK